MKPRDEKESNRRHVSPRKHSDLLAALEETESREKAHLEIVIPANSREQVAQFLKDKGFQWRQGIALLIAYGLSDETEEELEKLRLEKELKLDWLSRTYATMRFKTYQYSEENCVLTMNLRSMLRENQALKQFWEKQDLSNYFSKDEWAEATVEEYYRKYVFRKQE